MPNDYSYTNDSISFSTTEVEHFRKKNLILNKEISDGISKPEENRFAIGDGIFDYEGYLKAKIKILWILKEPYDTSGGGWHISEVYTKNKYGAARTTWYPIINVSHAILNGFQTWDNVEKMSKNNPKTASVLSHIAYINVQKLPSLTREKSNNSIILQAFKDEQNNAFFKKQFELLNPDIIIGANTMGMMFEHFGLKGEFLEVKPTENSYIVNGKLFINADHPASRTSKKAYLDNIVTAAREWSLRKSNL